MFNKKLKQEIEELRDKTKRLEYKLEILEYKIFGVPAGLNFGTIAWNMRNKKGAIQKLEEYLNIEWSKETTEGYKKIKK